MEVKKDSGCQKVDLIVFAGQSNMAGRGEADRSVLCAPSAGYEYKAVSNPGTLLPVREPFGLGEDKKGAIWDYDTDGRSKRTGSMVSAVIHTYHSLTGRRIVGVSASIGGSDTVQWKKIYLTDALERLEQAKSFLLKNHFFIEKIYVVWCQGESDGDTRRTAGDYMAATQEIFSAFQVQGAEKCFLVQTGHYNYIKYPALKNGLTGEQWDRHYKTIRDAQAMLCRIDDRFILAGSFEPYIHDMKDSYHYNQNAYNLVGETVGTTMAEYI